MKSKRHEIGATLFGAAVRLARSADGLTLTAASMRLGARKIPKRYRTRDAQRIVRDTATAIRARREARRKQQHRRDPLDVAVSTRLETHRAERADQLVGQCLRKYARQLPSVIYGGVEFAAAGAEIRLQHGWIKYRDRDRQGIVSAQYTLHLGAGWLALPDWLRGCDGLLTLAAIRRQAPEWQAAKARRDQQRHERIQRIRDQIMCRLERGRLNGLGDVLVTLSDSRRAGNCPVGTAAWVARYYPEETSARVADVVGIQDQHERVLLACAVAVRRARPIFRRVIPSRAVAPWPGEFAPTGLAISRIRGRLNIENHSKGDTICNQHNPCFCDSPRTRGVTRSVGCRFFMG